MPVKCRACHKNDIQVVCSVPGIPTSSGYCQECIDNGNEPMDILIASTALIGSLEESADWWKETVYNSLKLQGKTVEWFNQAVERQRYEIDSLCQQHDEWMERNENRERDKGTSG